jgi:hypothetical protein
MASVERSSALRRLSGTKKGVDLSLPTAGDNQQQLLERKSGLPPATEEKKPMSLDGSLSGPAAEGPTAPGGPTVPDRGATVLGIPVNKFSQLAGGAGFALNPRTPMGRLGGFVSRVASRELAKEDRNVIRTEDRANKLEDRTAKWAHEEEVSDERVAAEEVRYKRRQDESETQYQRRLENTELGMYKNDPEGYEKFKQAGRADKTTSLLTNFQAAKADGYQGSLSDWKAVGKEGSKDADPMKAATTTLSRYKGAINDEGGNVRPMDNLKKLATSGDRVAMTEYIDVAQAFNILPEGTLRPVQNNVTKEKLFFNEESNSYYDINGKQVKVAKAKTKQPADMKAH